MYYYSEQSRYKGFQEDVTSQGGFTKRPGNIVYSWEVDDHAARKIRRRQKYAVVSLFIMVLCAFATYLLKSDLWVNSGVKFVDYDSVIVLAGGLLVATLATSIVYEAFVNKTRVSKSFIDIDYEGASTKRLEIQLLELMNEIDEIKHGKEENAPSPGGSSSAEAPTREVKEPSAIESYIQGLIKSLEGHIELSDKKASKLLDTGTMYLRRGIYFYVASIFVWQVVAHVWGVDKQLIFGVVSCSFTFLVVEFLAAWFLKQYRSFIDSSIQFMRVKSVFDRYLLSYLAVKEFSNQEPANFAESKAQILKVLAEEIKWPDPINSKSSDVNHMVQLFDSLTGMLEKVKDVAAKKEKADA